MPVPIDADSSPRPRHTSEDGSRRTRRLAWIAAAASLVVAAVAVVLALGGEDDSAATASPPPQSVEATPEPSAPPEAAPTGPAPGEIVVEAGPDGLEVFAAPGDEQATEQLGPWTALGSPTTLLGFARETVGDEEWIQVELPGAPNHRSGWVRAADATVASTDTRIDIFLDERELELSVDGDVTVTSDVVIGADESPTPLGVFWVMDPLDFSANPSGVYGAHALGLNGWSETLDEFNGGPPQIAVHGTNEPELMGQAVSNGCIRVPNEVVVDLADAAAPGTPVVVHASRPD